MEDREVEGHALEDIWDEVKIIIEQIERKIVGRIFPGER